MRQEHQRVSGLSGNEIYCLHKLGMKSGQLCIGNSVVAIGVGGGIGAGLSTLGGGEVTEITKLVHDGRSQAYARMMKEAEHYGGVGLTGVSFDMIRHAGNLEFITVGSTVHGGDRGSTSRFSTSADAQQLFCQLDSGFEPIQFVFGNTAYSIGMGGNISGFFSALRRGEVPEYTEIFDRTRHLALTRIEQEAQRCGANAVVGIQTTITPLMGTQEMMMVGTASKHALAPQSGRPITSDMTNEEMWNMVHLGYMPLQLVMGVSVYSLGLVGGLRSFFRSLAGGEVAGLTELLYEAREKALARIEQDAQHCGADEVIGVKTRVYDLGNGIVEFMAIGTAVKKINGAKTKSDQLPPQAIIRDQDTFIDSTGSAVDLSKGSAASASKLQQGPVAILLAIFFFLIYLIPLLFFKSRH